MEYTYSWDILRYYIAPWPLILLLLILVTGHSDDCHPSFCQLSMSGQWAVICLLLSRCDVSAAVQRTMGQNCQKSLLAYRLQNATGCSRTDSLVFSSILCIGCTLNLSPGRLNSIVVCVLESTVRVHASCSVRLNFHQAQRCFELNATISFLTCSMCWCVAGLFSRFTILVERVTMLTFAN